MSGHEGSVEDIRTVSAMERNRVFAVSEDLVRIRERIEELERQRDNLQRCNNEYLERIRKAERVIPVTFEWARLPYGTGDLVHGDGF